MDYDDDLELTRYVWNHYPSLMTDFERRVGQAIIGQLKAAHAGAPPSHPLWARWGAAGEPDIEAALADGPEEYRRRVRIRLLAQAGDKAFVNRCPSCSRVVRTPTARQCFWCGHDWHQ
jgi:hypothetical protein